MPPPARGGPRRVTLTARRRGRGASRRLGAAARRRRSAGAAASGCGAAAALSWAFRTHIERGAAARWTPDASLAARGRERVRGSSVRVASGTQAGLG